MSIECIVPPYLLERLRESHVEAVARAAVQTLDRDVAHRRSRRRMAARPNPTSIARVAVHRTVDNSDGTTTLPGRTVRTEGAGPVGDPATDEAYDALGATWTLYHSAYKRNSLDDMGLPLLASVHYGQNYDNAFWNGEQMVFGDGDGTYFNRFTISVDVIGHELTHGVTQFTANLTYSGQSGALNESISDCFGSLVKQMALGQTAQAADWLIGQGLFTAAVKGQALRSMKAPGTAYDDPHLGKDPQPATMDGYVDTTDDDGGVHTNSGIPNHAFYLAATGIGGNAWEGAGQVWYDVLTGGKLAKSADFPAFAAATVAAAQARFGSGSSQARAVSQAWTKVKVATS